MSSRSIWIVDAYNVIFAAGELRRQMHSSLEEARDSLASACELLQEVRGDIDQICLVFDGRNDDAGPDFYESDSGVTRIFSMSAEKADKRIVRILREAPDTEKFLVVSGDGYVTGKARSLGAEVVSSRDFWALVLKKRGDAQPEAQEDLDAETAARITREYERMLEEGGGI